MIPSRRLTRFLVLLPVLGLAGCAAWYGTSRQHQSSSVVQFLYPDKDQAVIQPGIPTLRLPLRVGLAFVPPAHARGDQGFPEAKKTELLRFVSDQFKALPFVQSIEIVPTTYLRPGGGFDNLDQLRALMGIDVVALIAYDQAQNSSDTAWTLSYWTIVGAYVVPAQKNDTHTLMEAVVYDIASRKLLFRAPGVSSVKGHATAVRNSEELRLDSVNGFSEAARDLTRNLQAELELFKVRIKEAPDQVRIEHRPGYSGGGRLGGGFAALLLLLLLGRLAAARKP